MPLPRLFRKAAQPANHAPTRLGMERLESRDNPSGGLLDPTFGNGGMVLSATGSTAQALTDVSVLPDGRLLAAGYANDNFAAARYNPDGTPDASFGSGGVAAVDFRGGFDRAAAIAVQPGTGGKMLLAGTAFDRGDKFGVVRLNPNGTLDTSFGPSKGGGKVTVTPVARVANVVNGMAVLPDGRFILVGIARDSPYARGTVVLTRFDANGTPDLTFGNRGTVVSSLVVATRSDGGGISNDSVSVALDAGGRVVVAGSTTDASPAKDVLVARFTANGAPDPTFGPAGTGVVRTDVSGLTDWGHSLAIQPDGKLVVGGLAAQPNEDSAGILARYNPDGTLDPTFDGDGKVVTDSVPGYLSITAATALAVQPDGKIVTAGQGGYAILRGDGTYDETGNLVLAMRFNPDGSRDLTYGPSATGQVMTSLGYNARVGDLALQPNGRVVVAGAMNTAGPTATDPSPYVERFALVRYTGASVAPSPVQVGSFSSSSSSVAAGSPLTLTAGNVTTATSGATVARVAFYAVNSFGVEQFLGYAAQQPDGSWALTLTVTLKPGAYTLLAVAADSTGAVSNPLTLSLQVL